MSKRSISAKALVEDIRKGLSDAELMDRHELSHGQLQKVFGQLAKAGYIAQEELDGRKRQEIGAPSLMPPRPVPSHRQDSQSRGARPSPRSLPLSREEAARVRRNGLILILASYGLWMMGTVMMKLVEGAEPGSFLQGEFAVVLIFLVPIGWLVMATMGCLWRVRGSGQHPVWAIVAPLCGLNILVMLALPNRYEPESDRKGLWLILAVLALLISVILLSAIVKNLVGL